MVIFPILLLYLVIAVAVHGLCVRWGLDGELEPEAVAIFWPISAPFMGILFLLCLLHKAVSDRD